MILKNLIGLMSGTSLDGLDVVHVKFEENKNGIEFTILNCRTIAYPTDLELDIQEASNKSAQYLQILDKRIGLFYAEQVKLFLNDFNIDRNDVEAIASHGQTILHQPENGFTMQIGCGSTLAYHCGIPVINNFRALDVIAGGQGAPLVPIGDFNLFKGKAAAFINIGGFCNISYKENDVIHAFDVCPGNLPLNKYAKYLDCSFDKGGEFARNGTLNSELLDSLNSLEYYKKTAPKSLGTEWLEQSFFPLITSQNTPEVALRTITIHIAEQISTTLQAKDLKSVYLTGGGAKNEFLIEQIKKSFRGKVIIPEINIIDFKEALIFAYLGYCYLLNRTTTILSVTGAEASLSTGVLHKPGYPTFPHP